MILAKTRCALRSDSTTQRKNKAAQAPNRMPRPPFSGTATPTTSLLSAPASNTSAVPPTEIEGGTVIWVAFDQKAAGLLALTDSIKSTTPEAIRQLHALGLKVVMLTGDNRTTAQAVARKLGIDAVEAEVLPD